ncbi:acyl-coenzyme A diphosphatase NUDT19-like [Clytia hemisphaerica]|uniref:acyl-coenzyme A diphosphatase NUDT19-like n=1 Tax=Clytia hemisphaerica TaxID=252671 RepID=UPI0034D73CC5
MVVKTWREAATLILAVKSSANAYKLLMLQRSAASKFMPNAYVFPGGVKSEADFEPAWHTLLKERNQHNEKYDRIINTIKDKPLQHGLSSEIGYRLCALRETFEESGILITNDESGKEIVISNPNEHIGGAYSTLQEWRKNVYENPDNFFKMFHSLKLSPGIGNLIEWSSWLTPSFDRYRFDTMFYLCCCETSHDGLMTEDLHDKKELTRTVWASPKEIVNDHIGFLFPPQLLETQRMKWYPTIEELMTFALEREKEGIGMWCPHKTILKDGFIVTYPGDDHHNYDEIAPSSELKDTTIEEIRQQATNLNRYELNTKTKRVDIQQNTDWYGHKHLGHVNVGEMTMLN